MGLIASIAGRTKQRVPPPLRRRLARARAGLRSRLGTSGGAAGTAAIPFDLAARTLGPRPLTTTRVTDRLYDRLDQSDILELESRLTPEQATSLENATVADRKRLLLAFGVHHRLQSVMAKTGLSDATPPGDVHSMGRGPLAAGGTGYYADLVVDALDRLGIDLEAGIRGLDFGCSSGRVVRVLAAAYPNIEWHGCDPIESSISWAKANLKGIRFEVSPQDPPLPYEEGAFDFVFAISIWSHFAETAALRWFREMRRLIRSGGALVLTTHGPHSISHHARKADRSIEQLARIGRALYSDGYWFAPEFGETGDHGIVNPEWGTAFWTVEWLAANVCPDWHIAACMPGRAEDNQDAIVLERT